MRLLTPVLWRRLVISGGTTCGGDSSVDLLRVVASASCAELAFLPDSFAGEGEARSTSRARAMTSAGGASVGGYLLNNKLPGAGVRILLLAVHLLLCSLPCEGAYAVGERAARDYARNTFSQHNMSRSVDFLQSTRDPVNLVSTAKTWYAAARSSCERRAVEMP
jgi:hypothetical protein